MKNKRQFFWISSTAGDFEALQRLDQRMQEYYSQQSLRANYQEMLESIDEIPAPDSVPATVLKYICGQATAQSNFLEVGCGNGRFYRQLRQAGFSGSYTGIEMAEYVIEGNRRRHPEVTFLPQVSISFQFPTSLAIFAFYFTSWNTWSILNVL